MVPHVLHQSTIVRNTLQPSEKCKLTYVYRKGVDGVLLFEKSNYRKIQILSKIYIKFAGRIKCRSAN